MSRPRRRRDSSEKISARPSGRLRVRPDLRGRPRRDVLRVLRPLVVVDVEAAEELGVLFLGPADPGRLGRRGRLGRLVRLRATTSRRRESTPRRRSPRRRIARGAAARSRRAERPRLRRGPGADDRPARVCAAIFLKYLRERRSRLCELCTSRPRRRRDSSADYPRRARGVAAIRRRNIHVPAAASPRFVGENIRAAVRTIARATGSARASAS